MRVIVLFLFFTSCKILNNGKLQNACSFRQVSLSFDQKTDSTAQIELQKLGTNYLNFVINSCSTINENTVRLKGYVYYFNSSSENGVLKLQNVKIVEAINYLNDELSYKSLLGITDQNGQFDITVSLENSKMYILVSKEKYNPCSIQLLK